LLLVIRKRRQFEGQVLLCYAALYAVARFVIEFWRDDPRGFIAGVSTSQFIAIVVFVLAAATYFYRSRQATTSHKLQASRVA
jgi:phosphatidylglycerol:prolipoprotein diacylglycerol transferase